MLSADQVLKRVDSIVWRELADEVVVLNDDGTRLTTLNQTGAFIWLQLDGTRSLGAIAEGLTEQFEVSTEDAMSDVRDFCTRLMESGLAQQVQAS